ncbi:MAG: hypothetical protein IJZ11_06595 [Bacteroidaceae bacterium]|nr:hypothetical protein [Bacteroidaceae bacterium]MEE1287955.1 hypothetical protein [Bacteroidaceae bacterium]
MKKLFIIVLLLTVTKANINAQEIYDYLLDKSEQVINNPQSNNFDLKVAQFKATAMRYFRRNIILQEGSISSTWLDEQALALNEFITNFLVELSQNSNGSDDARKKIIMRYCEASANHTLFKNVDKEEAESFISDKGGYTPFCLNTNWVKALAESKDKKKE